MTTQGKARWGKKKIRVPDCECEYNFTCRPCLDAHAKEAGLVTRSHYYEVYVGNIGLAHNGDEMQEALTVFDHYVELSKTGKGRAGGESVTLLEKNEIVREYIGALDTDTED